MVHSQVLIFGRYLRYFFSLGDISDIFWAKLILSVLLFVRHFLPFCSFVQNYKPGESKKHNSNGKCFFCGLTFKEIRVRTKQKSEISRSVSYLYFCLFTRFVVNGSKILFQCTSDDRWDHSLYFANTLSMFPILPVPFNSVSDVIKSNSDRPDKSGKFHPNGAKHCYSRFGWQFCAVWKIWIHHL